MIASRRKSHGDSAGPQIGSVAGSTGAIPRPERRMAAPQARSNPKDAACTMLRINFGIRARAEALLRAFLAERDDNRPGARFWIKVYGLLSKGDR
jgi:hypothetical protein